MDDLEDVLRRVEQNELRDGDCDTLRTVGRSYIYLVELLKSKDASLARLRKLLFGAKTEKTDAVLAQAVEALASVMDEEPAQDASSDPSPPPEEAAPTRRRGHGRNPADAYRGAEKIRVAHESLQPGDACPDCRKGTVYETKRPAVLVRLTGQAPVRAKVYELQKLRCHLCGKIFTASAPEGVGDRKYDATAGVMIALMKYGSGLPFNRLAGLQGRIGVPLPASTQWEIVRDLAKHLEPIHEELLRQAGQGEVVHNDDTGVKILDLMGKRYREGAFGETSDDNSTTKKKKGQERRGLFTSGIVATRSGKRIALFFSGRKHAGENLADVLAERAASLPPPIQMCDALSRNMPAELETIVANCLAHGRRRFVEVAEHFPEACQYVLEALKTVYHNDAKARGQELSPAERLQFHQTHSGPTMADLHAWLGRQFDEHLVEPNSSLGSAIAYMLKHWSELTLFLRVAGAPLDNNLCERALKKAILHRKNALFYKSQQGAAVGDLFMSLIHTCELCSANPFDYLTELARHATELAECPERWLPWKYRDTLKAAAASPPTQ